MSDKQRELIDFFWEDYSNNYTTDIPYLRYEGPIPVWLYGQYTSFNFIDQLMKDGGCKLGEDFRTVSSESVTIKQFNPMSVSGTTVTPTPYSNFLLPPKMNIVGYSLTKKRVRGKLLTVSLKGLTVLDRFFANGVKFERLEVGVEKIKCQDSGKLIEEAWTYFARPSALAPQERVIENNDGITVELMDNLHLRVPLSVSFRKTGEMIYC